LSLTTCGSLADQVLTFAPQLTVSPLLSGCQFPIVFHLRPSFMIARHSLKSC
jgi:hypothetical protein